MKARQAALAVVVVVVGLVSACSGGSGGKHDCGGTFLGTAAATPTFTFLARNNDGGIDPVVEGGGVPLLDAPQGGEVLFAGIRATNLQSCGIQVTAALRDETTNHVIGLEGRPLDLVETTAGWGVPGDPQGLQNWSNIPVCPSAAATRGILGTAYRLEIQLVDRGGRTAGGSIHVVPFCGNPANESYCMTLCSAQTPAFAAR